MGYGDDILWDKNEREHRLFIRKLRAAREDIVSFVNKAMGWSGDGSYQGWLKGSFNIGYIIKRPEAINGDNSGARSAFMRFPIPGRTYSVWTGEKVKNEAMVLEYLREHTTIPVPRVYAWGPAEESPRKLGPFILMDFVEGMCLDGLLRKPTESEQEPLVLDPHIDQKKLQVVYSQIADFLLQLSRLRFPYIGAISKDKDNDTWKVGDRPMTYDMNELVAETGFPTDKLPSAPFSSSSKYFRQRADEMWTHLYTQRNICETPQEARQKFTARRRLRHLIAKHDCVEHQSFRLFGDDFGPFNMLADPETLKITAVLDFEFTNAMPAQYTYDVPSWLLLAAPHTWLERNDKAGFEKRFVPQMELFLGEMDRCEARNPSSGGEEKGMAARMRESWDSGRFWFNYAMRTSVDADAVYWKALVGGTRGEVADEEEMEEFIGAKMKQFEEYEKERNGRDS
ncbi:phosphotransferase enzyme family protein-like protein [Thelonectria olida]|uniref:Phosphotransferase enzyme family protein-like protein n=1 Tax=Thelonectria olida TaxID=1576542 RepID=A0A9P8VYQ7_9HYPO|nr:phosphotransferase enzyme family protein-like protein [Thelonectria olida]